MNFEIYPKNNGLKKRCCYFSDFVDPLICDGPCIEFVGIIAWSINQIYQVSFSALKRNLLENMS